MRQQPILLNCRRYHCLNHTNSIFVNWKMGYGIWQVDPSTDALHHIEQKTSQNKNIRRKGSSPPATARPLHDRPLTSHWLRSATRNVDRWQRLTVDPRFLCSQLVRADDFSLHPNWTTKYEDGYDAGLLFLSEKLDVPSPTLAASTRTLNYKRLYTSDHVFALVMRGGLNLAEMVVTNKHCPSLVNISADMFCASSSEVLLAEGTFLLWIQLIK